MSQPAFGEAGPTRTHGCRSEEASGAVSEPRWRCSSSARSSPTSSSASSSRPLGPNQNVRGFTGRPSSPTGVLAWCSARGGNDPRRPPAGRGVDTGTRAALCRAQAHRRARRNRGESPHMAETRAGSRRFDRGRSGGSRGVRRFHRLHRHCADVSLAMGVRTTTIARVGRTELTLTCSLRRWPR